MVAKANLFLGANPDALCLFYFSRKQEKKKEFNFVKSSISVRGK